MARNSLYSDSILSDKNEALRYPLQPQSNGKLQRLSLTKDIIVQSIKFFLVTGLGERVMESHLGSGIPNLIGRQLTDEKIEFVRNIISEKITKKFRQVEVISIDIENIGEDISRGFKVSSQLRYKDALKDDFNESLFDKTQYDNNFFSIDITIVP